MPCQRRKIAKKSTHSRSIAREKTHSGAWALVILQRSAHQVRIKQQPDPFGTARDLETIAETPALVVPQELLDEIGILAAGDELKLA